MAEKKEVNESEERYRILVRTIPDVIYELDPDGRFTFVSDGIKELGYKPEELIGKHFKEIIYPDDLEIVTRATILPKYNGKVTGDGNGPKLFDERRTNTRMTRNLELRLVSKNRQDDSICYMEVNSSGKWDRAIKHKSKKFLGSVGIMRNITERRKAEGMLREVKEDLEAQEWGLKKTNESVKLLYKELDKKNKKLKELDQLKSDFLSTVSHELRTPLTSMKNVVSNILRGIAGEITEKMGRYLSMMNDDIGRLSRLIEDLLDISRIEAGRMKLKKSFVDINAIVNKVVSSIKPQADKKNIELKNKLLPGIEELYADMDRINQVFTNIIGNAIKFTPEKGKITMAIEDKDKEVECSVSDSGIGIPENQLDKVFDKFHQVGRKDGPGAKGTGLGLPITKDLVEMHKGRIWVESELNKGSTFFFTLPKPDSETIFREKLNTWIVEAEKNYISMSLIAVALDGPGETAEKRTDEETVKILKQIEEVINKSLDSPASTIERYHRAQIVMALFELDRKDALDWGGRLRKTIKGHQFTLDGKPLKVQASLGMATYPEEAETEDELIKKLETSIEESKKIQAQGNDG